MENRWMVWGMGAMVALQVYSLTKLGSVEQLNRQVSSLQSQISTLDSRINNLNSQLHMMARASEWVVNPNIRVDDSAGCGKATVSVDWSLKEVDPGAKVEFLYRSSGEQEWHAVEATATGAGSYRAGFTVTGSISASPSISVESPTGKGSSSTVTESGGQPKYQYEYRIVATSSGQTRSSDPQSLDLNKAFLAWFQIAATVKPDGYQVRLTRYNKPDAIPCTLVTEARARGIGSSGTVVEVPFRVDDGTADVMWADLATKEQLTRIDVIVKYGAGNEETHMVYLNR